MGVWCGLGIKRVKSLWHPLVGRRVCFEWAREILRGIYHACSMNMISFFFYLFIIKFIKQLKMLWRCEWRQILMNECVSDGQLTAMKLLFLVKNTISSIITLFDCTFISGGRERIYGGNFCCWCFMCFYHKHKYISNNKTISSNQKS